MITNKNITNKIKILIVVIILLTPTVIGLQLIKVDNMKNYNENNNDNNTNESHAKELILTELLENRLFPTRIIDELAIKIINNGSTINENFEINITINLYNQENYINFLYNVESLGTLEEQEYFIVDIYTNLTCEEEGYHPINITINYDNKSSKINSTIFVRDNWIEQNITNISINYNFETIEELETNESICEFRNNINSISFNHNIIEEHEMLTRRIIVEKIPFEILYLDDVNTTNNFIEIELVNNNNNNNNIEGIKIRTYAFDTEGYFHSDKTEIRFNQ